MRLKIHSTPDLRGLSPLLRERSATRCGLPSAFMAFLLPVFASSALAQAPKPPPAPAPTPEAAGALNMEQEVESLYKEAFNLFQDSKFQEALTGRLFLFLITIGVDKFLICWIYFFNCNIL